MKQDIRNRSDIELMVKAFYTSLLTEESIKPLFFQTDLEKHFPHMYAFWGFVLLNEDGYKTNVMERHFHLPLKAEHFDTWLVHFNKILDENFEGETTELARTRAHSIAAMLKMKFEQMGKLK